MQDSTTTTPGAQNDAQDTGNADRFNYTDDNLDAIERLLSGDEGDNKDKKKKDDGDANSDAGSQGDDGDATDQGDGDDTTGDGDGQDDGSGDANADDAAGDIYSQEVKLADGTQKTVGELKDFYQQQAIRELELQERETALLHKLEENAAIAEALNVIPAHIRDRIVQERKEVYGREYGKVLSMIPAWRDRKNYEDDRRAIYELGEEYGLSDMFEKIVDARAVKFLYDVANLRKRIKAAGALIKQQKAGAGKPKPAGKPQPASSSAKQQDMINKAKTGSMDDKYNAISTLLGG